MRDLLSAILRWSARQAWRLFIVLAVLVVLALYPAEWELVQHRLRNLVPDTRRLETLTRERQQLGSTAAAMQEHLRQMRDAALESQAFDIGFRIDQIDQELKREEDLRRREPDRRLALLRGDDFSEYFGRDLEIAFLHSERKLLESIGRHQLSVAKARAALDRARSDHEALYSQWQAVIRQRALYESQHPLKTSEAIRWSDEEWNRLERERSRLVDENRKAKERATQARTAWLEAKQRAVMFDGAVPDIDGILGRLDDAIQARRRLNTLAEAVGQQLPKAVGLVVLLIVMPVVIKAFWYFVMAPLTSRQAPIRLRGDSGSVVTAPARAIRSAVSQVVWIDGDHELLVHPEYLQVSPDSSRKATKWLLDWRIPLSSLAAGMFALTRLRAASPQRCVVSSTADPYSEIAPLELCDGDALVLQPHNLVGVLQPVTQPVRITRHWRLLHLSAWLTLQFRYLVFHGPATLIVEGCRGVRIEEPEQGRSIDQAATIGFSANLAYTARRSETFGAYLLGKHGLFNDSFAGEPGVYVYEEMPRFGRKAGVAGRGLEGMLDVFFKAFGI